MKLGLESAVIVVRGAEEPLIASIEATLRAEGADVILDGGADIGSTVAEVVDRHARVDVLCCVGEPVEPDSGPTRAAGPLVQFAASVSAVAPAMSRSSIKRIVLVHRSTVNGPRHVLAGTLNLARCLAVEFAPEGIEVHSMIFPSDDGAPGLRAKAAAAAAFLASPRASFLTGSVIPVDYLAEGTSA